MHAQELLKHVEPFYHVYIYSLIKTAAHPTPKPPRSDMQKSAALLHQKYATFIVKTSHLHIKNTPLSIKKLVVDQGAELILQTKGRFKED